MKIKNYKYKGKTMNKKVIINIICIIPVITCMIAIFLFSAQPAYKSTETSSGFAEMLAHIITPDFDILSEELKQEITDRCQFIVRKTAHFGIYAILGILSYIAIFNFDRLRPKLKFIIPSSLCLIYAMTDEYHQYFVPGRNCSLNDVLLDFSGSITGILFTMLIYYTVKKYRKKRTF